MEQFLQAPGLLPFATLSQTHQPIETLEQVARQLEGLRDRRQQSNLMATAGILAGLVLEKEVIGRILRQDVMRESVIYQDIEAQGIQKGLQQGLQHERSLILKLLTRKIGAVPPEMQAQIESLSLTQLEELGEALLDFETPADLVTWLAERC